MTIRGASLIAQLVKNPPAMRETWIWSLGWEDALEKGKATHSSILAWGLPWTVSSVVKESACNAGDLGSIPRSGSSPEEGNSLQYSCLENFMDRRGGLQFVGSQRVRHDWATNTCGCGPVESRSINNNSHNNIRWCYRGFFTHLTKMFSS